MENLAYEIKKYTYEDIENLDDGNRYEIIDGDLYLMSSPTTKHQTILGELYLQFRKFFDGKKCTPFIAPLDVCIDCKNKNSTNVVQPDLMVVCDENKIKDKIEGAPDLVVEILSKNNIKHDVLNKFHLYQKYKVREYWIVDIENGVVFVYILNNDQIYTLPRIYKIKEDIKSTIFDGLVISLEEIFNNNQELFKEEQENYNWCK